MVHPWSDKNGKLSDDMKSLLAQQIEADYKELSERVDAHLEMLEELEERVEFHHKEATSFYHALEERVAALEEELARLYKKIIQPTPKLVEELFERVNKIEKGCEQCFLESRGEGP